MGYRPGELDVLQDIVPGLRVHLDQGELYLRKLRRFAQDFRRHGYLTDIMNRACHPEAVDLVWGKVHLGGDSPGQIGNAPLVTGSIRISRFNRRGHRLDDASDGPAQLRQSILDFLILLEPFGDIMGHASDDRLGDPVRAERIMIFPDPLLPLGGQDGH
ncbi:MAG: hypothetical protein ACD_75C01420G0002 [uncultured bacterium]|nr:MAG: hypothetical protein ACD_75C01420G0002 [uncultured bacterium]